MTIKVRYFAILRDRAGRADELYQPESTTAIGLVEELIRERGLGLQASHIRPAVNGQFVEDSHVICDGDEVVLLPPVAGG